MTKQVIHIDLDSLIDTRLGVLIEMNETAALDLLKKGYRTRTSDDWHKLDPVFDNDDFAVRYKNRTVTALKNSSITGMIVSLFDILKRLERDKVNTPFVEDIIVHLNVYPYKLTAQEEEEFVNCMQYYSPSSATIEIVNFPLSQLMPGYIDRLYSAVIIYDMPDWLALHQDELREKKIPTVTMLSPALYYKRDPSEEELIVEEVGRVDAFAAFEAILVEYIEMVLVDVKYFSVIEVA